MRPIDQRIDQTFAQALKCVEFRLPHVRHAGPQFSELCLGLRYGLVGVAAAHHLLLTCNDRDSQELMPHLRSFGNVVADRVQAALGNRWPFNPDRDFRFRIGELAREPLISFLPLFRRLCPLELCLSVVSSEFALVHGPVITAGRVLFGRRAALREFERISDESYGFALCFFERRQAGLEEVPEIALIGE